MIKQWVTLLLLTFNFFGFASAEDDLNNWLDSTFVAHEIDWNKTHDEFQLYTEEYYQKAENVNAFFSLFLSPTNIEKTDAYRMDNPEKYPVFQELSQHSQSLLNELEHAVVNLIFRHHLENSQHGFTRFLIAINYFNHVPLNDVAPKLMYSKMNDLEKYLKPKSEVYEKIALLILAKKIFLENTFIPTDELMISLAENLANDSLQIFSDTVLDIADTDPHFIGGAANMNAFIMHNIYYPTFAKEIGEPPSKIYISFVISKTGQVYNVKLRKGDKGPLEKQVLRVVKMMPNWVPAYKDGKPVAINFTLPIYIHWR